jgi:hypothetical protein
MMMPMPTPELASENALRLWCEGGGMMGRDAVPEDMDFLPPVEIFADGFVWTVGHERFFIANREHALETG